MQMDSMAESQVSPELLETVKKKLMEIDKGNETDSSKIPNKDPRDNPADHDKSIDASTGKEKITINPELRTGPSTAGGTNSPDMSGNTKMSTV